MYSVHPSRGIGPPQPPCQTHIYFNCLQMNRITWAKVDFLFAVVGRKFPASAKYSVLQDSFATRVAFSSHNSSPGSTRIMAMIFAFELNFTPMMRDLLAKGPQPCAQSFIF